MNIPNVNATVVKKPKTLCNRFKLLYIVGEGISSAAARAQGERVDVVVASPGKCAKVFGWYRRFFIEALIHAHRGKLSWDSGL